ncbi:MAG: SRPBCC family protein [Chitinophagaceae bacterium]
MAVYSLKAVQQLPVSIDQAWDFFSSPANLQLITPPEMGFTVISLYHGPRIYPGQIIEYKLKPLLGIPVYWMTEITHVQDKAFFVDEQRFGPYSLWHHQHHFRTIDRGVEMTDIVHYKLPLAFVGRLMHWLLVRKKLERIFQYRHSKIEELLGTWKTPHQSAISAASAGL